MVLATTGGRGTAENLLKPQRLPSGITPECLDAAMSSEVQPGHVLGRVACHARAEASERIVQCV